MSTTPITTIGECDCCPKTDVKLFTVGKILMCETCRDRELEVIAENRVENAKFNNIVENSRHQDQTISIKADIFNAATVSFVELKAAIDNDSSIAPDQKTFALVKEAADRIKKFNDVIFAEETALMDKKNERHAWVIQTQQFTARLREDERAKYKQFDISYTASSSVAVKKTLTTKAAGPSKAQTKQKFDKAALNEAAKKYNVPAAAVQSLIISRNMSAENAAKHLAELMGLIPSASA